MIARNRLSMYRFNKLAQAAILAIAALVCIHTDHLRANPSGANVVAGQATISDAGNLLTVTQGTDRAIIDWNDFSIQIGETTRFVQPSALSAVLNRVVSSNPSELLGSLQANGNVFLINTNGILAGADFTLDTGGFLASTLNVSNDDFLDGGDLSFFGNSDAGISNFGTLKANTGDIILIARQIENAGSLSAPNGVVGLGAGTEVLLASAGQERVFVQAGVSDGDASGTGISNTGLISATAAELKATGSMYSVAINNEGIVRATHAVNEGGRILLKGGSGTVVSSGTLDASSSEGQGGYVEMTGDRVGVSGLVDVSGDTGGGTALIGGGFQGNNPDVQNASQTVVTSTAELTADAGTSGDGGTVIVWADDSTNFQGSISATGGSESGDGGFAEVSAKSLVAKGSVDLSASNGSLGTVLYDPVNIEIHGDTADGSDDTNASDSELIEDAGSNTAGTISFTDTGTGSPDPFLIYESEIEAQSATANIILQATESITTVADGGLDDIVTLGGTASLTIETRNENGVDGAGSIDLSNLDFVTTDGNISISSGVNAGTDNVADITVGVLTTGAAGNTITISSSGAVNVNGAVTANDTVSIEAQGGAITTTAAIAGPGGVTLTADDMTLGNTINSGTEATTLQPFTAGTAIDLGSAVGGTLILSDAELDQVTAGILIIGQSNSGTITVTEDIGPGSTNNLRLQSASGITQEAGDQITVTGLATSGAGAVTLTEDNVVSTFASNTSNDVSFDSVSDLSIGTVGSVTGVSIGTNALTIDNSGSAGGISQANAITAGDVTITEDQAAAVINLNSNFNNITGIATLTAVDGDVTLNNTAATILGAISTTGMLTVSSGNAITQNGATIVTADSGASFTTTNNDQAITLTNTNDIAGEITFSTAGTSGDVQLTNNDAAGTQLGTSTVNGSLTVVQNDQAGAAITQTGASTITVTGDASFTNETTDTGAVSVANSGATVLGGADSTIGGNLTITSAGALTQTGAIRVNGDVTSNGAGSTTLDDTDNIIDGVLTASDGSLFISRVGNVDINVEAGGSINTGVSGSLTVIALQEGDEFSSAADNDAAITLTEATNSFGGGLVLNSGGATNTFTTTSAGTNNITQSDNITVGGTSTFSAPAGISGSANGGNITLNAGGTNALSGAIQFTGATVNLTNTTATNLGASTINVDLGVSSAGAITNSGILDVTGTSSFATTAGGASISVDNAGNLLDGAVSLNPDGTGAATLVNNQATVLGASTLAGGNLSVNSAAGITQTGALTQTVAGQLIITAGDAVDLSTSTNAILALGATSVNGQFELLDSGTLSIDGALNSMGNNIGIETDGLLTLAATSDIDAAGSTLALNSAGVTQIAGSAIDADSLALQGTGDFIMNLGTNNVATLAGNVTGAVTYQDSDAVEVGSVTFPVAINGLATGGGTVTLTTANGAANSITLTNDITPGAGGDVLINAGNALANIVQGGGTVNMTDGLLRLQGSAVGSMAAPILTTGQAATTFTLEGAATNDIYVSNSTNGNIQLTNTGVDGFSSLGGVANLVNSGGNIAVDRPVSAGTAATVDASGGDLSTLIGQGTIQGGTSVSVSSGGAMTIATSVGTVGATDVSLSSGTTMELQVGSAVGSAGATTVTVDNDGTFTRTGGTAIDGVTLNLLGTGAIGTSTADRMTTSVSTVAFTKTAVVDLFLQNDSPVTVQGTINGNLDFRTTGVGSNITIGSSTGPTPLSYTSGAGKTATIISSAAVVNGVTGGTSLNLNGADAAVQGTTIGSNLEPLGLDSGGTLEANATGGGLFINHTGSGLIIDDVSADVANTSGLTSTGVIVLNQAASQTLNVNANVTSASDLSLIIADSGAGGDQLFIDTGVTVGSGGNGGTIVLGGGVNNQGTIQAITGTTVTVDGGRPDLELGGVQTFNGDVTFALAGDIIVTGQLTQTNPNGSLTFEADSDDDGVGGFLFSDFDDPNALITSAGSLSISGSNLQDATAQAYGYGGGTGNGVVIVSALGTPVIQTTGSALVGTLDIFSNPDTAASNVVIDGIVRSANSTTAITSTDALSMNDDIRGANVTINNTGDFTRTGGTITAPSGTLLFEGAGNVGTLADRILTNVGIIDFDSTNDTKVGADAFISESSGVALQGSIQNFDLVTTGAGSVTNSVSALTANEVTLDVAGGSVDLNLTNSVSQFNTVSATGFFTYVGGVDLVLNGEINAPGIGGVNINVGGNMLTQNVGANLIGNTIGLTFGDGTFGANVGTAATTSAIIENSGLLTQDAGTLVRATTLTLQGTGDVGNDLSDGLLTRVTTLTLNKPTSGDVNVTEFDSVNVDGTIADSLFLETLNTGNVTQNNPLAAGMVQIETFSGNINLSNTANQVAEIGVSTANNGFFLYDGSAGGSDTLVSGAITTTDPAPTNITPSTTTFNLGANTLTFNADGDIFSDGVVTLNAGQIDTAGDVTSTNDNVSYNAPTTLTGDVAINTNTGAGNVLFADTLDSDAGPFNLTVDAGTGDATFSSTVGAGGMPLGDLIVNATGTTTFTDDVTASNVTTNAGGTTIISGGADAVVTTADQFYGDAVQITADTTLTGVDVTFDSTLDSDSGNERSLLVTGSGDTSFNDNVGVNDALTTLETDAAGTTIINGNAIAAGITVQTSGTQTYNDAVEIGGGTTSPNLLSTGTGAGDILFMSTLDGQVAGTNDLRLTADAGNITFTGSVGTTEMGDIVITSANDVNIITAPSITSTTFLQESGTGTTTISGDVTTSSSTTPAFANAPIIAGGGVQINTNTILVDSSAVVTAQNSGIVRLDSGSTIDIVDGAEVRAEGSVAGNQIILDATTTLTVGDAAQTDEVVVQTDDGGIQVIADTFNVQASDADSAGDTTVNAQGANGTLDVDVTNAFTIDGGDTVADSVATVSSNAAQDVDAGSVAVSAGTGDGGNAILNSNDTQSITAGTGMTVTGGNGAASLAQVTATGNQDVTVTTGDLAILGGQGADSVANITGSGSTQDLTVQDGNLTVTADQTNAASTGGNATILADGAGSTQTIIVGGTDPGFGNGYLTIMGGVGSTETATIESDGASQVITVRGVDNASLPAGFVDGGTNEFGLGLLGGTGDGSTAIIDAAGSQAITILASSGDIQVIGGNGAGASATITAAGTDAGGVLGDEPLAQDILAGNGNILVQANQDGTNAGGNASIELTGGDTATQRIRAQNAGVGGDITVQGGANAETATITSNGAQMIVADTTLSVLGGSGANSGATIVQSGAGDTTQYVASSDDMTLTGGTGDISAVSIDSTDAVSRQTIEITGAGDLLITGGDGAGSSASITSSGTDGVGADEEAQRIVVAQGDVLITANQDAGAVGSDAFIWLLGTDETQSVTLDTGAMQILGGAGDESAFIYSEGNQSILVNGTSSTAPADGLAILGGTGDNTGALGSASIVADQDQSVTVTSGDLAVTGGDGEASIAGIQSNGPGATAQMITVVGGNLLLTGNQDGANNNALAGIETTDASSTQTIDVQTGNIQLLGGAGTDEVAEFSAAGSQFVTSEAGISVTGGTGTDSGAGFEATGPTQMITVNNNDLTMIGGDGSDADAYIIGFAGVTTQTVMVSNGNLTMTANQDNGADNSDAIIDAQDAGVTQTVDVSGMIDMDGGAGNTENATISSAGIQDIDAGGSIDLMGGTGDNSTAGMTATGDQNVNGLATITLTGGSGDNTTALIDGASTQTVISGTGLDLNGGTGDDAHARIEADNTQIVTVTTGDLTMDGGNGEDSDAAILAQGAAPSQTVTVSDGNLLMSANQDNGAADSDASITLDVASSSQIIDVSGMIDMDGGAGSPEVASIHSEGTQDIDAGTSISLTGGSGDNSTASITAEEDQNVEADTTITLLGGSGAGASASIDSASTQTVTAGTGLSLDGGTGDGSHAFIEADDTQAVNVTTGDLTATGGNGEDSDAFIRANAGATMQTVTVSDGSLSLTANQDDGADNSDAFIAAMDAAAVQTVDVTGGGVSLMGGSGATETAYIMEAGANGLQTLNINSNGDLTLEGGSGLDSTAFIRSAGTDGATEAQHIMVAQGNVVITADQVNDTTTGGEAFIETTNASSTQLIEVQTGAMQLQGGVGDDERAFIMAADVQTININGVSAGAIPDGLSLLGGSGSITDPDNDIASAFFSAESDQTVTVTNGDLAATAGDGADSNAGIISNGPGATAQMVTVASGNLLLTANQDAANDNASAGIVTTDASSTQTIEVQTGNIQLLGGAGMDEVAVFEAAGSQFVTSESGISLTGGTGEISNAEISAVGPMQIITVNNNDLTLEGGDGENADALINGDVGVTTQTVTVSNGALSLTANQDAGADNSDAFIVAMDDAAVQTVEVTGGGVSLMGGAGSTEHAYIMEMGANGRQTITVTGPGDLSLLGGDGENSDAIIRSFSNSSVGGSEAQSITVTDGDLLVRANQDATANNSDASIETTDAGSTQIIRVSNGGITVEGGDGETEEAFIGASGVQDIESFTTISVLGGGDSVVGGTSGDNSEADITADSTQRIVITDAGDLIVTGGYGEGANADIISNGAGASAQMITVTDGSILLTANQNADKGTSNARIMATDATAGSLQTISVLDGTVILLGGAGSDENAQIDANREQTIGITGVSSTLLGLLGGTGDNSEASITADDTQGITVDGTGGVGLVGGNGSDSDAFIRATAGNPSQTIIINSGQLTLTGNLDGTNGSSDAFIEQLEATGSQTIDVTHTTNGSIVVTGGNGLNEDAYIDSEGSQDIDAQTGITVTGGDGDDADAFIEATGPTQDITVDNNNLSIVGGDGDDADAYIVGNAGVTTQNITVSNGALNVTANPNSIADNSDAYIEAHDDAAVQTISVTGGGITLRGGFGADEEAWIRTAGANSQQILLINTNGDLTLMGGSGLDSTAFIRSAGTDGATEAQRIIVAQGNVVIEADQVNDTTTGGGAFIETTNASSTQLIDVQTGAMQLQGGVGTDERAYVMAADVQTVDINGVSAGVIPDGLSILGGSGDISDSDALIASAFFMSESDQAVTVTNGDLAATAGDGTDAHAGILSNGPGATAQMITVVSGDLLLTANQDAANDGASAGLVTTDASSTQTIDVQTGNIQLLGGAGMDEVAVIEAEGSQLITSEAGISITGGTGTISNAEITAIGPMQIITVNNNDLTMTGGNGEDADALIIGNLGVTTQTVTVSNGNLIMMANQEAANGESDAFILANDAGVTQTVDVSGMIDLTGGAGSDEDAVIFSEGTQGIDAGTSINILGGSGDDGDAGFDATGDQDVEAATTITLTGGSGDDSDTFIETFSMQNVLAGTGLDLNGGSGDGSIADIHAHEDQLVTVTTGNLTIDGGSGEGSDASITTHDAVVNQAVTVSDGDLLMTGGTGPDSSAFILAEDTATTQTVTVSNGSAVLMGGSDALSGAYISLQTGGDQIVDVSDMIDLDGGSALQAIAAIASEGTQDIDAGTTIDIMGGSGDESLAGFGAGDSQNVTAGTGMSLTGGTGDGSDALVEADGDQSIDILAGDLSLLGGDGEDSDAFISGNSNTATAQTINVDNGFLLVRANQDTANNESDAYIETTDAASTQTIRVDAGAIVVEGGDGISETASIESAGNQDIESFSTIRVLGGGDPSTISINGSLSGDDSVAEITSGGTQQIVITDFGDLIVTGGFGEGAVAEISSGAAGANAQTITVSDGNIFLSANQDGFKGNGDALIFLTNVGDQVVSASGDIEILGGVSSINNEVAGIVQSTLALGGTQDIDAGGAITLTGGSGENSEAFIFSIGEQSVDAVTALTLTGGSGDTSNAYIEALGDQSVTVADGELNVMGGSGSAASAWIQSDSDQTISADSDINLIGGDGEGAMAFIRSYGAGASAQMISTNFGSISILGNDNADNDNGDAFISSTDPTAVTTIDVNGVGINGGHSLFLTNGAGAGEEGYVSAGSGVVITATQNVQLDGDRTFIESTDDTVIDVDGRIIGTGEVRGETIDLDAVSGIHDGQDPQGNLRIVGNFITADNTGEGFNVRLINTDPDASFINSLTAVGGEINFENVSGTGGGSLTVDGFVTSGVDNPAPSGEAPDPDPDINGGDITIIADNGLFVNEVISSVTGTGGTLTILEGVTFSGPAASPVVGEGDIFLAGGGDDLYIGVGLNLNAPTTLTARRDVIIDALVTNTDDFFVTADRDVNLTGGEIGGILITNDGGLSTPAGAYLTGGVLNAASSAPDGSASVVTEVTGINGPFYKIAAGNEVSILSSEAAPDGTDIHLNGAILSDGLIGVDSMGDTFLGTTVTSTAGTVNFFDNVLLSADSIVNGDTVDFAGTIDGTSDSIDDLTVSGTTINFNGAIGSGMRVGALTVNLNGLATFFDSVQAASVTANSTDINGIGDLSINGGSVDTTGDQTYNISVLLGDDAVLSTGTAITFNGPLDGPGGLQVTDGEAIFNNVVGDDVLLDSLTMDAGTTAAFNSTLVHTSGAQLFNGDATTADGMVFIAGTDIIIDGTFDSEGDLTFVVDDLFPNSPDIGEGLFDSTGGTINIGGGGVLHIYGVNEALVLLGSTPSDTSFDIIRGAYYEVENPGAGNIIFYKQGIVFDTDPFKADILRLIRGKRRFEYNIYYGSASKANIVNPLSSTSSYEEVPKKVKESRGGDAAVD